MFPRFILLLLRTPGKLVDMKQEVSWLTAAIAVEALKRLTFITLGISAHIAVKRSTGRRMNRTDDDLYRFQPSSAGDGSAKPALVGSTPTGTSHIGV